MQQLLIDSYTVPVTHSSHKGYDHKQRGQKSLPAQQGLYEAVEMQEHHEQNVLLFSHSVMSSSLHPHGLQHARLPCPSPSPGVCPSLCPLSQCCYPTISSSVVPFSSILPSIRVFSNELAPHISWPKYWSFGLSGPSNRRHGLAVLLTPQHPNTARLMGTPALSCSEAVTSTTDN